MVVGRVVSCRGGSQVCRGASRARSVCFVVARRSVARVVLRVPVAATTRGVALARFDEARHARSKLPRGCEVATWVEGVVVNG